MQLRLHRQTRARIPLENAYKEALRRRDLKIKDGPCFKPGLNSLASEIRSEGAAEMQLRRTFNIEDRPL
jgi:hypothetical protein